MRYPRSQSEWQHHRVIHSKYPPIDVFDSEDSLLLAELEGATSDRVANWSRYIDPKDIAFGPGWGPVNGAFCYPRAGRFNTLERGVYYAADSVETALREWCYHTAKTWQGFGLTDDVSAVVRAYTGQVTQPLVDVRRDAQFKHDTAYAPGQALAAELYQAGEWGIRYASVRNLGGEAVALLRPTATTRVTQASHYTLRWDGSAFKGYAAVGEYQPL